MPKLIMSLDGVVTKEAILSKEKTTVGRRPYNDIVIDNLAVSGEHAMFHLIAGEVYVEDMDSTNGTFVNARPVKKELLADGDTLAMGKYRLLYQSSNTALAPVDEPHAMEPVRSAPVPLASLPTEPAPLEGLPNGSPFIRFFTGPAAGTELTLQKVVTTVGTPGKAVAAVTRRLQGYVLSPIDAGTLVNGRPMGNQTVSLVDGDTIEVGEIRLQFVHR